MYLVFYLWKKNTVCALVRHYYSSIKTKTWLPEHEESVSQGFGEITTSASSLSLRKEALPLSHFQCDITERRHLYWKHFSIMSVGKAHCYTSLEFSYLVLASLLFSFVLPFNYCSGTSKLYQVNAHVNIPCQVGKKKNCPYLSAQRDVFWQRLKMCRGLV